MPEHHPVEHHTPITAEEIAHVFEEGEEAPVDLSVYSVEDWITLVVFWGMACRQTDH